MATFDNRSTGKDETGATIFTFTDRAIGTAAADRQVYFGILCRATTGLPAISSVTIGGVTATALSPPVSFDDAGGGFNGSFIYAATVPTGTTATVVVTFTAAQLRMAYVLGTTVGMATTAFDTLIDTDDTGGGVTVGGTIDVETNGIIFGISFTASDAATGGTWVGATEFVDDALTANARYGAGYLENASPETGRTLTCAWAGGSNGTVFAAVSISLAAAAATARSRGFIFG